MDGVIKSIGALRRRASMSREALFERWLNDHAPFVAEHAKPERYRITLSRGQDDGSAPHFDGMVAMWFRDEGHYDAWFGEGTPRGNDGFFDVLEPGAGASLKTSEHVIVDGEVPPDGEKVVYFVRRGEHVSTDELFSHWRDRHAPNVGAAVKRTEGCLRYVISHGDLGVAGSYDGIAEIWWSSAEARRAGLQGVEDDGFGALIDREQTVTIAGSERAIVG